MMIIMKLLIITAILLVSSKALGDNLYRKWKPPFRSILGLGYLCNISIFFVLLLPVMLLKLSYVYLMISGCLYLIINLFSIGISYKNKTLFEIHKEDVIAFVFSVALLIVYFFCLDFGNIETYDSYFYSALTNNAANTNAISVVDPYTGLSNLQNFYKYMSFYYMSSFYGNLFGIQNSYLVLIWSFTFMNFILIFNTAFTVCRISKYKIANNIMSLFYLTLILSLFRAPFNALHLTTFVISIYVFRFSFHLFKGRIQSIYYLLICVIASISFTSTSLFTLLPFAFILFVTNSIIKSRIEYKYLFIIMIPVILLGGLYLYESLKTPYILLIVLLLCVIIYSLFRFKWFNIFVRYFCYVLVVFVIGTFFFAEQLNIDKFISANFMQSSAISENEVAESRIVETCLGNNSLEFEDNDSHYDYTEGLGSALNYISGDGDKLITKIMILITHSVPKYGGLLFLLLYGAIYRRNQYSFIAYILYLIMFNNPFVSYGVNLITMGLSARIILFFNTYFALIGIKYFFDFIYMIKEKRNLKLNVERLFKNVSYGLGICLIVSIMTFAINLKPVYGKDYNFLYKMPNSLVNLEKVINNLDLKGRNERKPRYFFTQSVFNTTMIDSDGENKSIIMNSKEYMNYLTNHTIITDKTMINDYFESEGKYDFNLISKTCELIEFEEENQASCSCDIVSMFKLYDIDYVITKRPKDIEFYNKLKNTFNIEYQDEHYMIIKLKEGA